MNVNQLILLISCLISISCAEKRKSIQYDTQTEYDIQLELELSDIYEIPIDTLTNSVHLNKVITLNDTTLYIHYNDYKQELTFFNLNSGNIEQVIPLSNEGKDAIGEIQDFYVQSLDSIFIIDNYKENQVILLNKEGELTNIWQINKIGNRTNDEFVISSSYYNGLFYNSDFKTLFFCIIPYLDSTTKGYYQLPLIAQLDILTGEIINEFGYFPDNYLEAGCHYLYDYPSFVADSIFINLFFSADHHVIRYKIASKINENSKQMKYAKSVELPASFTPIMKFNGEKPEINKQRQYLIENPSYGNFIYDQYRNLYYRLVKLSEEYLKADGSITSYFQYTYELMVLDKDFNVIGSKKLPPETYSVKQFFVSPKGLFVGLNNPLNENYNENLMRFQLFKMK